MKISIINHDSTASLKVETYDSNSDMKASLETTLIMANQGNEPKEFNLAPGRAILLTASPDMTLGGNTVVINPDSQQNMVVSVPVGSNASASIASVDSEKGAVAIPPTPVSPATNSLNKPLEDQPTATAEHPADKPAPADQPKPVFVPMSDAATVAKGELGTPPQDTNK